MALLVSWNVAGLSTTVQRIVKDNPDTERSPSCSTVATREQYYTAPARPIAPSATALSSARALASYFFGPSCHEHPTHLQLSIDSLSLQLRSHQATILCVQEHKIPRKQLVERGEPHQLATLPGYESFWSCCTDTRHRGLNGVVTYAPVGSVIRANGSHCFGDPTLDEQGRCVLTDHGSFVLFNVYVPASGGHSMSRKMKFLRALRRAMQRERAKGKSIILAGDLNIAVGPTDIFWKDRVIHVQDIVDRVERDEEFIDTKALPQWMVDVAKHWRQIVFIVESSQNVVATQTTNPTTKEKFDKYRLSITIPEEVDNSGSKLFSKTGQPSRSPADSAGRRVYLGDHETSPERCRHGYNFEASYYFDEDLQQDILMEESNAVPLHVVSELMAKIVGVAWDDATLRRIADTAGTIRRASPPRRWLVEEIFEQDHMVDTFRHFYPTAEGRFTCWNQFTNQRYSNNGSRIDYFIVDPCFLPYIRADSKSTINNSIPNEVDDQAETALTSDLNTTPSLRCGAPPSESTDPHFCLTEEAALQAATANGRFEPVGYHGGGIMDASQSARDSQFGRAHTGMIYTPPSYSDHIAISLLLQNDIKLNNPIIPKTGDSLTKLTEWIRKDLVLDGCDPMTRKAQPHKMQRSITTFLSSGPSLEIVSDEAKSAQPNSLVNGRKTKESNSPTKRILPNDTSTQRPKKNSILYHFRKKHRDGDK